MKFVLALFALAVVVPSGSQTPKLPSSSQLPHKVKLFRHHSTIAWSCGSSGVDAFVYEAGLAVDADGAYRALGIESNPRTGGIEQGVGYVIYPGSGNGTPRTLDEIVSTSGAYFRRWGALQKLRGCVR